MRAWIAEARAGARRTCVFERFPMLFTASDSISRSAFIRVLSFLVVSAVVMLMKMPCLWSVFGVARAAVAARTRIEATRATGIRMRVGMAVRTVPSVQCRWGVTGCLSSG